MQHLKQCLAATLCAAVLSVAAAEFPAGPVKFVHAFPGGLVDAGTRALADQLSARWKQPAVIEGKPGGNEVLAARFVATAPADGHTLLVATESVLVNNLYLYRKLSVDARRDLVPVGELFEISFALVVRGDLPVSNVQEFVEMMRKEGKRRVYASSGPGSPLHLAMEGFRQGAGFEMTHVPYKTMAQVTQDMLGGLVDAVFISVPAALPFVPSGKLKILAVTGARRSALAPETPTFAELGFKGMDYRSSVALMAPRATPPDVLRGLGADVREVLRSQEFAGRFLAPNGLKAGAGDAQQLQDMLAARRIATERLIKDLDIRLD